jgi:hypothetical protein
MERGFSVEMGSKQHVRSISISDETHGRVLFEGSLGRLKGLRMIEGEALEVEGAYGVLRVDLRADELLKAIEKPSANST